MAAVEELARNRVNLNKVITHWPDMLKVAGSLVTNQVRAYDLLRMLGRENRPVPLGVLGRYSFTAGVPAGGVLRPLRDPDAPELDDDEDGSPG
jgi:Tn3 transposase DDE domain